VGPLPCKNIEKKLSDAQTIAKMGRCLKICIR